MTAKRLKQPLRYLLAVGFIGIGIYHFLNPAGFERIVPEYLPWRHFLVLLSGFLEALLGGLLLFRRTMRVAAWGLIALLIAVFPANIEMALHPERYVDMAPPIALYIRLPLQLVLIAWAWWYTRPDEAA